MIRLQELCDRLEGLLPDDKRAVFRQAVVSDAHVRYMLQAVAAVATSIDEACRYLAAFALVSTAERNAAINRMVAAGAPAPLELEPPQKGPDYK